MSEQGDSDVSESISNPSVMEEAEGDGRNAVGAMARVDDQDGGRARTSHRHSADQIQQLENYYQVNPLPTVTQRLELARRLNMDPKQVKFWFENKRHKEERRANRVLREERDRLRADQERLRRALILRPCTNCGRSTNFGDVDSEMQRLMSENAMLKWETDLLSNFLSCPHIQLPGNTSAFFLLCCSVFLLTFACVLFCFFI